MRAEWNKLEPIERNLIRWVYRRWLHISMPEKVVSWMPLFLSVVAYPNSAYYLLGVIFTSLLIVALALLPGNNGYKTDEALSTDPSPCPDAEVDVLIKRQGTLLGEDTGVLSQVDGWLVFMGHRTTFSLRPQHSGGIRWYHPSWDGLRLKRRKWAILSPKDDSDATVWIRNRGTHDEDELKRVFYDWGIGPVSRGMIPVFPPRQPHREAFLHCRLRLVGFTLLVACAVSPFLIPVLSAASHRKAEYLHWAIVVGWNAFRNGGILSILLFFGIYEIYLAFRDLRRLRRYADEPKEDHKQVTKPSIAATTRKSDHVMAKEQKLRIRT